MKFLFIRLLYGENIIGLLLKKHIVISNIDKIISFSKNDQGNFNNKKNLIILLFFCIIFTY
jgi:hypothetical protein